MVFLRILIIGSYLMPLSARRVLRLSLTITLSLAISYAIALPLAFLTPLFALVLTATPAPPLNLKKLLSLILLLLITLGTGLIVLPLLNKYPATALLIIAVGLFLSAYLSVKLGKGLVGTLLAAGLTVIPAAGVIDYSLAVEVIKAFVVGISLAIACQWVVYPWFPEDKTKNHIDSQPIPNNVKHANWIALRFTLIVLPPFLLALANPAVYLKLIMKSIMLGQQSCEVSARDAGRELLGSTFLGGYFAILFWVLLKINPSLWMFSSWMLLFGLYFSSKIFSVLATRFTPSFWINVVVTMLILLGAAVQDSVNGDDVYQAFIVRMSLFIVVAFYAWAAIYVLDLLYKRSLQRALHSSSSLESL